MQLYAEKTSNANGHAAAARRDPFDVFHANYPAHRRGDATECRLLWRSMGLDAAAAADALYVGMDKWLKSEDWTKEGGKFVPGAAKFLRERKWETPPPPAAAATSAGDDEWERIKKVWEPGEIEELMPLREGLPPVVDDEDSAELAARHASSNGNPPPNGNGQYAVVCESEADAVVARGAVKFARENREHMAQKVRAGGANALDPIQRREANDGVLPDGSMGMPIPLDGRIPPPLPPGIFTGWLGDMIDAVSAANETPPDLAATMALAVLGTVCQKRFTIRPESGYFEPLAAWPVCAMVPGNRKTSVMMAMTRPLIQWERAEAAKVAGERKAAESLRKTQEARIAEMRTSAKKKDGEEFAALCAEITQAESELAEIPSPLRLTAQDVTPERTAGLLAENGERLGIFSDEGGIFDLIGGRYSEGMSNTDLFNQAHSGTFVRVDRGGNRPPIVLHHPAITFGLSPQPSVLAGLTKHKGFRGTGFLARFWYSVPSSKLGYRSLVSNPVPDHVAAYYDAAVIALANVPANAADGEERPRVLSLSGGAWGAWKDLQRDVETMMRPGGRLENLTDWGGKLAGAVARIAGLIHLAEFASCPESAPEVGADVMARAVAFGRYLIEHALIVFDLMGADEGLDAARRLWVAIAARRAATFTAAEIWHPLRGTFKRAKDAEPGWEVLIERCHIEELPTASTGKVGRPSRRFRVNPLIVEGWE